MPAPGFAHFIVPTGEIFEVIERSEIPSDDGQRGSKSGSKSTTSRPLRAELIRTSASTPISEIMGVTRRTRGRYFRDPEGNVFEIKQAGQPLVDRACLSCWPVAAPPGPLAHDVRRGG